MRVPSKRRIFIERKFFLFLILETEKDQISSHVAINSMNILHLLV